MGANSELACVYAALILADDDVAVTPEKITTILKAAGVDVEPYWPGLFSKALESVPLPPLVALLLLAVLPLLPLLRPPRRRRRRKSLRKRTMTWASGCSTRFTILVE